jgi:hypothetical protein
MLNELKNILNAKHELIKDDYNASSITRWDISKNKIVEYLEENYIQFSERILKKVDNIIPVKVLKDAFDHGYPIAITMELLSTEYILFTDNDVYCFSHPYERTLVRAFNEVFTDFYFPAINIKGERENKLYYMTIVFIIKEKMK